MYRLPLHGDQVAPAYGDGESLSVFLAPVGDSSVASRIGEERVVRSEGDILVTEGERYRDRHRKLVYSGRYLLLDATGIYGSLNYSVRGRECVVSNIFVDKMRRRQGCASRLVDAAKMDHPGIKVDSSMTLLGAQFFGYGPQLTVGAEPQNTTGEIAFETDARQTEILGAFKRTSHGNPAPAELSAITKFSAS